MFSRKLFSSSLAPTKGLLLHSRRPAARASSIGAAKASTAHVRSTYEHHSSSFVVVVDVVDIVVTVFQCIGAAEASKELVRTAKERAAIQCCG